MKVVAFNGSPRVEGNTSQLLDRLFVPLAAAGIETEKIDIAPARPRGCTACMKCAENQDRKCVIATDPVNEWIAKMIEADGIVFASPTYFGNVTAEMKALIDRAGFVARVNDNLFARKVGAAVVAVRRGGAVPTFDAINHMFQINEMILVGSIYWNFGFGMAEGDVADDDEGLATMDRLGENMAWVLGKLHG
jgi:multimeric flavodoxin WrbA